MGVESTIVDLTGARPRLLRPGGVTPEQLKALLGELDIDKAVVGEIAKDAVVRAPGMKYTHYTPSGDVIIVTGTGEEAAHYILRHLKPGDRVLCYEEELGLYPGERHWPMAAGRSRRHWLMGCSGPCGIWTAKRSPPFMPVAPAAAVLPMRWQTV